MTVKRVLGLIPARGGSVRCPRKNLADLGGKPLLVWAIEAARYLTDYLAVSTEDDEIAACAAANRTYVLDRPYALAQDDTPMLPVVRHALDRMPADVVLLLQPTSPFRTREDIISALDLFKTSGADAVVSVTQAPSDMVFEIGHAGRMRLSEGIVVPNGAIYILSADAIMRGHDWYSGVTYAYQMPRDRSIDIDTAIDLAMARAVVEQINHATEAA